MIIFEVEVNFLNLRIESDNFSKTKKIELLIECFIYKTEILFKY